MIIIDYNNSDNTFMYFDSMTSIANLKVDPLNKKWWSETISSKNDTKKWLGTDGGVSRLREICELHGWEEGVSKGLEKIGELEAPKLPSIKRKRCKSSYGSSLDISRMYSGNFEKMWNTTKREICESKMTRKGLVNIIIDMCASAYTSADSFFWRGALGCILARALQESGRKVRLMTGFAIKGHVSTYDFNSYNMPRGINKLTVLIDVKKFDQPVEYNRMFSMTALAGFFRIYGFKAIFSLPWRVTSTYGRPAKLEIKDCDYVLDDNPCIIIENIWNEEDARERATSFVKELQ